MCHRIYQRWHEKMQDKAESQKKRDRPSSHQDGTATIGAGGAMSTISTQLAQLTAQVDVL